MRPYSLDLRERVVAAVARQQGSLRQLARRFCVSLSFVARLLRRHRQTGSVTPAPHGGGHPRALTAADDARLRELVGEQPDATLAELRQRLGVSCSLAALDRALRRLRLTRKKKVLRAQEQASPRVQALRQDFRAQLARLAPERLVFVDGTGTTTALTRRYGRGPRGQRVVGTAPGSWRSVTLVSALRLGGIEAALAFEGATDTAAFQTYVETVLGPQLRPGDVVIWDNLQPHKAPAVKTAITRAGAEVLALPPWSPDLTPIEKMFSKVKEVLRSVAARTTTTLYEALGTALVKVCPQDIVGWFQSCGLCATQT